MKKPDNFPDRKKDNKHLNNIRQYIAQLMAKSAPDSPVWNIEKIKDGKAPAWNYIDGCMMTALLNLYIQTNDAGYLNFADNYVDWYIFEDGGIRGYREDDCNLDNICGGRVLFDLVNFTGKEKYARAIEYIYSRLQNQPRTLSGNFWHKKIYPDQVWLDGLYMAQVFYTRYCTLHNLNYEDIINQFKNVRRNMFDNGKKLYYHGYDESRKAFWCGGNGLSQSFWLRSMGWYLMALIDVIGYLPDKAIKEKTELSVIFAEAAEGVLQYIDGETNMFYQVIDKAGETGNYTESSGSAMVSYAFLKGARLGILPETFGGTGKNIFFGICDKYLTEKDGELNLGGICLMAGLGPDNNRNRDGTYGYYISEPVVENDAKGTAPLLLAYTEILNIMR